MASTSHSAPTGFLSALRGSLKTARMGELAIIGMSFAGILIAYLTSEVHIGAGLGLAIAAAGVFFMLLCILNPFVGYFLVFIFSAFISMPARFFPTVSIPGGLLIEMMTYLVLVGVLAEQRRKGPLNAEIWKTPIAIILLINLAYFFLDVLNPVKHSLLGWSLYVRKHISFMVFYYISWAVLNSYRRIQLALNGWILLSAFIGLYAIKQHFIGFADFESAWIYADPDRPALYFQGGFMRKFSILSDPSIFALVTSAAGVMTLVFGIRHPNKAKSFWLLSAGVMMIFSTFFSGTRTANLIIAAAVFSYIVFTFSELRSVLLAIASALIFVFIMYGPMNNMVVQRIRSTMEGKKDPSQMVRENTRHAVQPYLYAHPMGGGIYSCGIEGELYNPGHYLMPVQPDSGYMKIFLEQGWIGLLIHVILLFTIVKTGLEGFYQSKKHFIKTIYIALTVFIMGLCVGQISQIAIWGYPYILFFYNAIVIFYKLKYYDNPTPENEKYA